MIDSTHEAGPALKSKIVDSPLSLSLPCGTGAVRSSKASKLHVFYFMWRISEGDTFCTNLVRCSYYLMASVIDIYFLILLEATSSGSRCHQGWLFLKLLSLSGECSVLYPHVIFSLCLFGSRFLLPRTLVILDEHPG